MIKNCVICGAEFEAKSPRKTCGYSCSKEHRNALQRNYAMKNREKLREAIRRWREQNADKNRMNSRNYYERNKNNQEFRDKMRMKDLKISSNKRKRIMQAKLRGIEI